jgi:hypothetical protein
MKSIKEKINIRIETNEECIDNFNLTKQHQESLEDENNFLRELLKDLYAE